MDKETLERAKAALASSMNRPLLEYFEAKLVEAKTALVSCTKDNFQVYQGRALELQETVALIKSVK